MVTGGRNGTLVVDGCGRDGYCDGVGREMFGTASIQKTYLRGGAVVQR